MSQRRATWKIYAATKRFSTVQKHQFTPGRPCSCVHVHMYVCVRDSVACVCIVCVDALVCVLCVWVCAYVFEMRGSVSCSECGVCMCVRVHEYVYVRDACIRYLYVR